MVSLGSHVKLWNWVWVRYSKGDVGMLHGELVHGEHDVQCQDKVYSERNY